MVSIMVSWLAITQNNLSMLKNTVSSHNAARAWSCCATLRTTFPYPREW